MDSGPRVLTTATPVETASELVCQACDEALSARSEVRLAIPGGSAMAAVVAIRRGLGQKSWQRVLLTWVDERCVPLEAMESNRGEAYRIGALDESDPPSFELPLYLDGEAPGVASIRIDAEFRNRFAGGIDVALLGMGEDGHIASLFPHRSWSAPGASLHLIDSPKPPARRISLTRATLATASCNVLLATSESKRQAIEALIAGDVALPAHALPGLIIVTDLELAVLKSEENE